jgi:hypothetical protein
VSDWDGLGAQTRQVFGGLPDRRTGENANSRWRTSGQAPLGFLHAIVFFLAHQKPWKTKGRSNAQSSSTSNKFLRQSHPPNFGSGSAQLSLYDEVFQRLRKKAVLESYRPSTTPSPSLDGTWYPSQNPL